MSDSGSENEHAIRAPGEVQAVQDQTGLDRFAEAHLIRQQHAREQARGDFARDGKLVRDEIDAPAGEPARERLPVPAAAMERFDAQIEGGQVVRLAGKEALLRLGKADGIGELRLRDLAPADEVDEQALRAPPPRSPCARRPRGS